VLINVAERTRLNYGKKFSLLGAVLRELLREGERWFSGGKSCDFGESEAVKKDEFTEQAKSFCPASTGKQCLTVSTTNLLVLSGAD
jgi:hypothetical protein